MSQVWKLVPAPFVEKVTSLILTLQDELELVWSDPHFATTFLEQAHKTSFHTTLPSINEIMTMVGSHLRLYNHVLALLRKQFKDTGNHHLATLRVLLPLALARANSEAVFTKDPCYKFASLLSNLATTTTLDEVGCYHLIIAR
jgi:hypothetical protein